MRNTFVIIIIFCLFPFCVQAQQKPLRVVSMNLCTDQLAYMLADQDQLISLSYLSLDESLSLLTDQAKEIGVNYGHGEEIIRLKPDLVLAGSYTTHTTVNLLKHFGIKIVTLPPAQNFEDIKNNIIKMGEVLGQTEKANAILAEFDEAIERLRTQKNDTNITIASYGANYYTTGDQTLESYVVQSAGYQHLGSELGITGAAKLTLESLILHNPDLLMSFDQWYSKMPRSDNVLAHPALRKWFGERNISLDSRYWICGSPHILTAIENLKSAVQDYERAKP